MSQRDDDEAVRDELDPLDADAPESLDEDAGPEPWAKTSSGDADEV
ncbi:MAG: hypothetical protein H0V40_10960 [Actinobacteria bacterium]|nr:hypothetical protein [Actinomycetota bacterium]